MKKFFASLFILFAFFFIFISPSFASEKTKIIVLPENQTVNSDYFAFAQRVELNGTVNGDAYVAGGIVIINGTVNGDLLTAGGMVTISGKINGDVRVAGGNIQLTGANITGNLTLGGGNAIIDKTTQIKGSIVAGSGNMQIFAPIGKGALLGGGSVLIANSIGGDTKIATEDLSLASDASLSGNLTYISGNELQMSDGASVSGQIVRQLPPDKSFDEKNNDFAKKATAAFTGILIAIKLIDLFWLTIFGLLIIIFFPNFTTKTADYINKKIGWALLIGLVALLLIPILGIILFITIVGIPIALVLMLLFVLIFWIGRIFAIFALGKFVIGKISTKNDSKPLAYLVGVLIYLLLSLIPIIGSLTTIIVSLSGVGAMLFTKKGIIDTLRAKNIV
jgi:hypothetical protein